MCLCIAITRSTILRFHTVSGSLLPRQLFQLPSPKELTDRSLLLHGKGFLGILEGSWVSSSITNDQWSSALYEVGSKGQLCRPWPP